MRQRSVMHLPAEQDRAVGAASAIGAPAKSGRRHPVQIALHRTSSYKCRVWLLPDAVLKPSAVHMSKSANVATALCMFVRHFAPIRAAR
jgi:hypothetical protein